MGFGIVDRCGLVALTFAAIGCQPELPPCDPAAATEVVFLDAPSDVTYDDGVPMYAGQALLHLSCGGGTYCHAASAEGILRAGTPHGLDFDVAPVCFDSTCTPGDRTLAAFEAGVGATRDRARTIYASVENGHMPPGRVGRRVSDPVRVGLARRVPTGASLDAGSPLPSIETREGRRIVGNWLACGAPVIQTVRAPDAMHLPGDACDGGAADLGSCVTRIDAPLFTPSSPGTFSYAELYEHLIGPLCAASCHGVDAPNVASPRFSPDAAETYATLLANDGDDTLVVPGSARTSHLYNHLAGNPGYSPMPTHLVSGRLPSSIVSAVQSFIDTLPVPP